MQAFVTKVSVCAIDKPAAWDSRLVAFSVLQDLSSVTESTRVSVFTLLAVRNRFRTVSTVTISLQEKADLAFVTHVHVSKDLKTSGLLRFWHLAVLNWGNAYSAVRGGKEAEFAACTDVSFTLIAVRNLALSATGVCLVPPVVALALLTLIGAELSDI